jgi:hypothetical protein
LHSWRCDDMLCSAALSAAPRSAPELLRPLLTVPRREAGASPPREQPPREQPSRDHAAAMSRRAPRGWGEARVGRACESRGCVGIDGQRVSSRRLADCARSDARPADVFSLGCLAHVLLSGAHPFDAGPLQIDLLISQAPGGAPENPSATLRLHPSALLTPRHHQLYLTPDLPRLVRAGRRPHAARALATRRPRRRRARRRVWRARGRHAAGSHTDQGPPMTRSPTRRGLPPSMLLSVVRNAAGGSRRAAHRGGGAAQPALLAGDAAAGAPVSVAPRHSCSLRFTRARHLAHRSCC